MKMLRGPAWRLSPDHQAAARPPVGQVSANSLETGYSRVSIWLRNSSWIEREERNE